MGPERDRRPSAGKQEPHNTRSHHCREMKRHILELSETGVITLIPIQKIKYSLKSNAFDNM